MGKLRLGILGPAKIAGGFAYHVRASEQVEVAAVASRSHERAEAFARQYGVPRVHGSYEALLEDPEVDAIYVPLPNALHGPWTLKAAEARKHILCEKPLAMDEAEAFAMFEAASRNGVLLLEAFPFHFQPQTLEVERLIAAGEIGEVRTLQAAFGFTLAEPRNVRWDPALGGGALYDLGCYLVSLARLVFGARPLAVGAVAHLTDRDVDLTLLGTLEYPGGGLAQISCSFATAAHRRALIVGTLGAVETGYANHTDREAAPILSLKRGTSGEERFAAVPVPRANGFLLEAEAFAAMIAADGGLGYEARRAGSLDNAATLAALLRSARTGARTQLGPRLARDG